MSSIILSQNKRQASATIVEINLVRNNGHIFYNRRENGQAVVTAKLIDSDQAQEIYYANAERGEWQRTTGAIDFGTEPRVWSWSVKVVEVS
jgi:hypothetical protein